jgi:hypothetical protein
MQINVTKFTQIITGLVALGLIGATGYFMFLLFFSGEAVSDTPTISSINTSVFGPKTQKAAAVLVNTTEKIALKKKDIAFTESALYKSFTDIPDSVSMSDSRGRPDPFVPYVAP